MLEQVGVLILAAGSSSRMGRPKMLLPAPQGNVLKQTISQVLSAGPLHTAVIAAEQGPVRREHIAGLPVEWLETDRARQGLGASLSAGIGALAGNRSLGIRSIMVLLGDQPLIDPQIIRRVAERYLETGDLIVQAKYTDRPAHPVLFDSALFPELQNLSGDEGARSLLRAFKSRISYVDADCKAPDDIDTPEDYEKYIRQAMNMNDEINGEGPSGKRTDLKRSRL
ncbi:nucleotidyltransferase family protein [Paenibacillus physcomitrellae]|uniref:MobA-like NTP transferase domain-containing protein n=1 Tax=Paenibacillus physcomitrellae TaxID=1619311 RepID=A0ABQ1FRF7_9BACL|nr:nucleotidyltransferase family protein [Paenibacillus physcomitrellae]GGA26648.1 hypothetical protein GCM10010917_09340 [Paenibacillus physcomitrellae]